MLAENLPGCINHSSDDFVDGQETDAWGLKEGMNISATAVTETPETVVSQEVVRTGTMPSSTPQLPRQGAILFIIVSPSKLP